MVSPQPAVEKKEQNVTSLVGALIGTVIAVSLIPMLQRLLGVRDVRDTSMAIISPRGAVYFLPHLQACRIVRKQNWSFASLTTLTRLDCLKSFLRGGRVYRLSAPWKSIV